MTLLETLSSSLPSGSRSDSERHLCVWWQCPDGHWHLCDPRTRPWSWALAPSFTNCNYSPTFKNCFPLGKWFHHLLTLKCGVTPQCHSGVALMGSVISVGSLGHIWVRGCLSLGHSMELRRDYLYSLLTMTGALSWVFTVLNFLYIFFFKTCQWVNCTKISCPLRVLPILRICDNIYY